MQLLDGSNNNRILVVDDNEAIHEDFNKILATTAGATDAKLDDMAASLFGEETPSGPRTEFELTHALQGQEALELSLKALRDDKPFALAFVDVRMPPGWNGIETVEKIWEHDHEIEIVLCTVDVHTPVAVGHQRLAHAQKALHIGKAHAVAHEDALAVAPRLDLARRALRAGARHATAARVAAPLTQVRPKALGVVRDVGQRRYRGAAGAHLAAAVHGDQGARAPPT